MMHFSLEHIIREPIVASDNPPLLLMLHGYGSNEQDLFSFAHELPDELLIVSARAPMSIGFGGYAWYTIRFEEDNSKFSDVEEAKEAKELIRQFLIELKKTYHYNEKKSFLMGFSQGTILSYALALSYPDLVNNVIAMSGYINEEMIQSSGDLEAYKELSVFCSHGYLDDVIPIEWARKIPSQLAQYGVQSELLEYNVGHGVSPENFQDLMKWLEFRVKN